MSHQKDLDSLTDEAHSLTQSAGVESIKLQVSQMNVRYQNLVSLIKVHVFFLLFCILLSIVVFDLKPF